METKRSSGSRHQLTCITRLALCQRKPYRDPLDELQWILYGRLRELLCYWFDQGESVLVQGTPNQNSTFPVQSLAQHDASGLLPDGPSRRSLVRERQEVRRRLVREACRYSRHAREDKFLYRFCRPFLVANQDRRSLRFLQLAVLRWFLLGSCRCRVPTFAQVVRVSALVVPILSSVSVTPPTD